MGTNSIKKYLDKETAISNIKLLLSDDICKKNAFVVVEGDDDVKFLKRYLNNNIQIIESYSGKTGVEEIVNSKVINSDRVIGIRDRDYYQGERNRKIFFYDRCCLEMMLADFDKVFEVLCCEFYEGEMEAKNLKDHILNELNIISQLRRYNEINCKKINFNGIRFQSIIDDDYKIIEDRFTEMIANINSGKEINIMDIISKTRYYTASDMTDITNGHDFIKLFKVICDKNNKSSGHVKEKDISRSLRTIFNENYFKKTNLYKDIKEYFYNKYNIWGF